MSTTSRVSVVFIHGLWMHASSWDRWLRLFSDQGYATLAPGWPGEPDTVEAARSNTGAVADRGIGEVTDYYAAVISELPTIPVVVGHSFGGLVAQRLLGMGLTRGCVAISPAQFRGVLALPPAQLRSAWPVLRHPRLRKKTWAHSPESFHRSFANTLSQDESDEIYGAYAIPSPARPLFQAGLANFSPHSAAKVETHRRRGPLLLIAATGDRTVPETTVRSEYKIQRRNAGVTEYLSFPGRSHALLADDRWREVADAVLEFLSRNGLGATAAATGS